MNMFRSQKSVFSHVLGFTAALGAAIAVISPAEAADLSFRGSFSSDDDVQLFNFSVTNPATVTLRTYSFAGGTQADGTVISAGGFDPILALFDGSGRLIDQNDDGNNNVQRDPVTGSRYDTFLSTALNPGNYTVSIMQFANFAAGPNLSNGFTRQGTGNFRNGFVSGGRFQRTSAWAFDVLNVSQASIVPSGAAIPTPALLPGLIGMGVATWRKRKMAV